MNNSDSDLFKIGDARNGGGEVAGTIESAEPRPASCPRLRRKTRNDPEGFTNCKASRRGSGCRRNAHRRNHRFVWAPIVLAAALCLTVGAGHADTLDNLIERLDRLEGENWQLRKEIDALKTGQAGPDEREETAPHADALSPVSGADRFLEIDSKFSYEILDPSTSINRKQRLILERRQEGPSRRTACMWRERSPRSPTTNRATGQTSSAI